MNEPSIDGAVFLIWVAVLAAICVAFYIAGWRARGRSDARRYGTPSLNQTVLGPRPLDRRRP